MRLVSRIPHLGPRITSVDFRVAVDRHADHFATEDHLFIDEALELELGPTLQTDRRDAGCNDQPLARKDGPAKPDVAHTAEAEEVARFQDVVFAGVKAGQLSGTFAEDDAWHEWESGHVSLYPELVVGDVLEADEAVILPVDMHDAGELFHLMTLRVDLANLVDAEHRLVKVELRQVVE